MGNPNLADTCTEALIAEGVADILALTLAHTPRSRFDGVGIAPVTTPRKLVLDPEFVVWVAAAREVIIHADALYSRGTGQRAAPVTTPESSGGPLWTPEDGRGPCRRPRALGRTVPMSPGISPFLPSTMHGRATPGHCR